MDPRRHSDEQFWHQLYHPQIFAEEVLEQTLHAGQLVANLCPHPRQYRSCGRGFGKSTGLVTALIIRRAVTLPHIRRLALGLDRPLPYKALLAASTKEQAFEIQTAIRQRFVNNDVLAEELSVSQTTKTNIVLRDGQRILVRPATSGARGIHPDTVRIGGQDRKGTMDLHFDEFAFFVNDTFNKNVARPMMTVADPMTSLITWNSTPNGQVGETYEILSDPKTGHCMQKFDVDYETGQVSVKFDAEVCKRCIAKNHVVKFQFPTAWNPHADKIQLFEEKKVLYDSGLGHIYDEEYGGVPASTAGLFFTEELLTKVWARDSDAMPQYLLNGDGEFIELTLQEDVDEDGMKSHLSFERNVDGESFRKRPGVRFLAIDPNSGLEVKKSDYAAIALVEFDGTAVNLLLCERFKVPPKQFRGVTYSQNARELSPFLLDYAIYLIESFDVTTTFIDSGGGGPLYLVPLQQRYTDERVIALPTSERTKNESLLHLRGLIMREMFRSPPIRFLQTEAKFLRVNRDAIEDVDKLKVEKAAAHGTAGKEVDGWFAVAYACRGTMELIGGASLSRPKRKRSDLIVSPSDFSWTSIGGMLNKLGRKK